jgi:hypothetical protein
MLAGQHDTHDTHDTHDGKLWTHHAASPLVDDLDEAEVEIFEVVVPAEIQAALGLDVEQPLSDLQHFQAPLYHARTR